MPPESDDSFSITVTVAPGRERADLVLSGDVDLPARPLLADVVDQLAAAAPHTVVVDLAEVTYGGSVLVNFLAGVHHAVPVGSLLVVCRPTPLAYWVLRITNMDEIARIREDLYA
jgi:anti-anti-sigma factor